MRIFEIINLTESVSLESTIRAIIADIGRPVSSTYETLSNMAEKYVHNNGSLKGFALVAGGTGNRWYNTFYFNKLQSELYDLVKYVPRHTSELKQFLSKNLTSFSEISNELPRVLASVAKEMKNKELFAAANRWSQVRSEYLKLLSDLEASAEDDNKPPSAPKPAKSNTVGQQASQVDQIISDVLRRVPKNVAGDIRNAIAKVPNKLQALQQELQKRNIKL